ncbi:MAG: hypothetical protein GY896_18035, partial [Gammaproteobacteria bacterium]|nr:hypothetical protein [Gammaproteobacteria bacterium]MCP4979836.1 hypothetical protein [Gammaproteobacteria bacterium]
MSLQGINHLAFITDDDPLEIAAQGAEPQAGYWPAVETATPPSEMCASSGNGQPMREYFLQHGLASYSAGIPEDFEAALKRQDSD